VPFYNRLAAVNYSKIWAHSSNPVWGARENNSDCTNFVSQALYAGGWTMVHGHPRNHDSWFAERLSSAGAGRSFTWSGAQPFCDFLQNSGRAYWVNTPNQLNYGDVVQLRDIGEGGGRISHTMLVTRAIGNDIRLSYHTADWLDTSYSDMKMRAGRDHTPLFWKLLDHYSLVP
jgi:Putative amidase domain